MQHHKPFILAVDGPAGSGKSTVCAQVAEQLGFDYVNTGALYRAIGILLDKMFSVPLDDEEKIKRSLPMIVHNLDWDAQKRKMYFNGQDITGQIYSQQAAEAASRIAEIKSVRQALIDLQRQLGQKAQKGAVLEGRDIGTVIFPDADLKIFLIASLEERAQRRLNQLKKQKNLTPASLSEVMEEIAARDARDAGRDVAPLKPADDAVVIDTTGLTLNDVVLKVIDLVKNHPKFSSKC